MNENTATQLKMSCLFYFIKVYREKTGFKFLQQKHRLSFHTLHHS